MKGIQKKGRHMLLAGILVIALLCITGCGEKETAGVALDLNTLQTDMFAADTTLPEMTVVSSEDGDAELNFSYLSDLDYNLIDSYFYGYAADGTAPEMAVVKVKDTQAVVTVMDSLKEHIESRKGTFQEYSPDQVELVEKAVLIHQDAYVALIISDKSGLVQKVFKGAFE